MLPKYIILLVLLVGIVFSQDYSVSRSSAEGESSTRTVSTGKTSGLQKTDPRCQKTRNGCKCKSQWMFALGQGEIQNGCSNPDEDQQGLWCAIDQSTCNATDLNLLILTDTQRQPLDWFGGREYLDYCPDGCPQQSMDEITCQTTQFGCDCKQLWTFSTPMGTGTFKGCVNADNDPKGAWCKINVDSCKGVDQNNLGFFSDTEEFFDYCKCKETLSQPPPTEPVVVGDCVTTKGCYCLSEWTFQEYIGYNCDNPDNWEKGPWCIVSKGGPSGTCIPAGTISLNDTAQDKFFDTCTCEQTSSSSLQTRNPSSSSTPPSTTGGVVKVPVGNTIKVTNDQQTPSAPISDDGGSSSQAIDGEDSSLSKDEIVGVSSSDDDMSLSRNG